MAANNIWSVSSDRLIWSRLISNLDTEIALLFYSERTFSISPGSQIYPWSLLTKQGGEEYSGLSALSGKLFTFSQIHLQLSIKGYRIPLPQLLQTDKSAITTQTDNQEKLGPKHGDIIGAWTNFISGLDNCSKFSEKICSATQIPIAEIKVYWSLNKSTNQSKTTWNI